MIRQAQLVLAIRLLIGIDFVALAGAHPRNRKGPQVTVDQRLTRADDAVEVFIHTQKLIKRSGIRRCRDPENSGGTLCLRFPHNVFAVDVLGAAGLGRGQTLGIGSSRGERRKWRNEDERRKPAITFQRRCRGSYH